MQHRTATQAHAERTVRDRPSEAGEWLTSEAASRRLGLARNTLAEWRCERRVNQPPFARFGLRALRYRTSDLDAWAASQVVRQAQ